jgi:hypothetical protein
MNGAARMRFGGLAAALAALAVASPSPAQSLSSPTPPIRRMPAST